MVNQAVLEEIVPDQGVPWDQYAGMGAGAALTDFAKASPRPQDRRTCGLLATAPKRRNKPHIDTASTTARGQPNCAGAESELHQSRRSYDPKETARSANVVPRGTPEPRLKTRRPARGATAPP